jgi:2',3'-cyclic-nucleotide 2'-phosphodiesterase (5'-nucleotidase family)
MGNMVIGRRNRAIFSVAILMLFLLSVAVGCNRNKADVVGGSSDVATEQSCVPSGLSLLEDPINFTDVTGNHQTIFLGEQPQPLQVKLTDESGSPISGTEISFVAKSGPRFGTGSLATAGNAVDTDTDGVATYTPDACETAGGVVIEAVTADNSEPPVSFNLTCFPARNETHRPLTIVHFNDFHTHIRPWGGKSRPLGGLARLATLLKQLRREADGAGVPIVVTNSGDDFENTMIHEVDGALTEILIAQDKMGVDIYQIGNHDFEFGVDTLSDVMIPAAAAFVSGDKGHPLYVLWGNVDPSTLIDEIKNDYAQHIPAGFDDQDGKLYRRTQVLDFGDLKVGVIGVATDDAIYTQVPGDPEFLKILGAQNQYSQGLTFFSPDPRDNDYFSEGLDYLDAQGADFIIVSSHAGLGVVDRVNLPHGNDNNIVMYAEGTDSGRVVDTVLSGHSHVKVNHAIGLENPAGRDGYIIQGEEGALYLTRQDYWVDTENNTAELIDSRLIQVDGHLEDDAETDAMVIELEDAAREQFPGAYDEVISYNRQFLSSKIAAPSGLGEIIGRSFIYKLNDEGLPTDISLAVASLYRIDLYRELLTAADAFDVLPLHKMDNTGRVNDTIAYLELKPGLWNAQIIGLSETRKESVTSIEYLAELLYSINDVLYSFLPAAAEELNIDVVQLVGMEFELDLSAPPMQRIKSETIKINGEPPDPTRTYRFAMMETLGSVAAKAIGILIQAENIDSGSYESMLGENEQGQPFTDSEIPLWIALRDYIGSRSAAECGAIPEEEVAIDFAIRTVQPDPAVDTYSIELSPETVEPGDTVTISATIYNIGINDVDGASVGLYYESTPWLRTDDPDGLEELEGLDAGDTGSVVFLDSTEIVLMAYPDSVDVVFSWQVPEDLPPFEYPLFIEIDDVEILTTDPNTGSAYEEAYPGNNGGAIYPVYLKVQ